MAIISARAMFRLSVVKQHLKMMSASATTGVQDDVLMEKIGNKGVITLNRPAALNALNLSMTRKIQPQLTKWVKDSSVTMVIIKGAGGKAFCAGGDIRAITDAASGDRSIQQDFFREEYILNYTIGTLRVPWIALIDGITMGGGVGLSVHGKYRIATERTMFAMPETAIGLFPDVGGGYFLPRLAGQLGVYLALTGYRLKGRDVQKAGVATHFVESSKLAALEKDLLALPNGSTKEIEQVLMNYDKQCTIDCDKPFSLEGQLNKINSLFDSPTMEGIVENLRQDGSDWAKLQIQTLAKMSPTSLKVGLRQLREGAHMTFKDVLRMEYRLTQRFVLDKDFYEGVRAVLIDKDQKPAWNPARLDDVTKDKIDSYFAPLSADRELNLGQ